MILAISAPIIAASFGVPQIATSFAFIAIIPFIQSFSHLGIRQVEGTYDYFPQMLALVSSQLAAPIVLIAAVYIFRDHRAVIVSLVTECAVYMIASHMLARAPYRLQADRMTICALLAFGIPLMINGLGLAMVSQLDRAFIGSWFDVSTLALYAVILSMSTVPISLIDRVFGMMTLSYLVSKSRDIYTNPESYLIFVFLFSVLGTVYSLFIAISLDVITPLIFGSNFVITPTAHVLMNFSESIYCAANNGRTNRIAIRNWPNSGADCSEPFRRDWPCCRLHPCSLVAKHRSSNAWATHRGHS